MEVVLDDLTLVGKVIDAALQAGANNIQQLQFGLKNPQAARSQALRQAAVQAKANAEAMADGLGVHVVRVLSVEEDQPDQGLAMQKRAFAPPPGATPPTEVQPGTIDVSVAVILRVEVTQ